MPKAEWIVRPPDLWNNCKTQTQPSEQSHRWSDVTDDKLPRQMSRCFSNITTITEESTDEKPLTEEPTKIQNWASKILAKWKEQAISKYCGGCEARQERKLQLGRWLLGCALFTFSLVEGVRREMRHKIISTVTTTISIKYLQRSLLCLAYFFLPWIRYLFNSYIT